MQSSSLTFKEFLSKNFYSQWIVKSATKHHIKLIHKHSKIESTIDWSGGCEDMYNLYKGRTEKKKPLTLLKALTKNGLYFYSDKRKDHFRIKITNSNVASVKRIVKKLLGSTKGVEMTTELVTSSNRYYRTEEKLVILRVSKRPSTIIIK